MHMPEPKTEARRWIGADGIELASDVGGDPERPAVILMHGGGQTRHSWSGAFKALVGANYFVINLDARGHGDSEWSKDGRYDLDLLADDLMCVARELPCLPALVGASMGGATLLHAAGRTDERIARALVLVDIVPEMNLQGTERIRNFMSKHVGGFESLDEAAAAIMEYNPHRKRKINHAGLMKNLRLRDGRYYWHWDPAFLDSPIRAEPPAWQEQLTEDARRIKTPTLLVRGRLSDIVTDDGVESLRRAMPHLEVADVAEAGHMVVGDKNDVFNERVISFLGHHLSS